MTDSLDAYLWLQLLDLTPFLPPESTKQLSDAGLVVEAIVIPSSAVNGRLDLLTQHLPCSVSSCYSRNRGLIHLGIGGIAHNTTRRALEMLHPSGPTVSAW
jgi:hypothetical protein